MRIMLHVAMDTAITNDKVKSGAIAATLEGVLEKLKPEAAYFHPSEGRRGMTLVIDAPDGASLAGLVEPFWLETGASVSAEPVMNAEELRAGLARLG